MSQIVSLAEVLSVHDRVTIKGTREGLLVLLGPGDLGALVEQLEEHLADRPAFFRGGRVALSVGARRMTPDEILSVGDCLGKWGMSLWSVQSDSAETMASARELGLETGGASPAAQVEPGAEAAPERSGLDGVVVLRTLRSGQTVQSRGHVTIVGDVNPGAEVVAGGSVVVWGRLRGTVHAGAFGDRSARICALQLAPTQLRIADAYARAPDEGIDGPQVPEVAALRDEVIVVDPWDQ